MVNRRAGRPRGASTARQALIDAAQRHLDAGDLTDISSRDLAAELGLSHTLVNYHFGSRDGLIAAAIGSRIAPHDVIARARLNAEQATTGALEPEMAATVFTAIVSETRNLQIRRAA